MIPPLVTLAHFKRDRRIDASNVYWDEDAEPKLMLATDIVMNHCKLTAIPPDWLTSTAPDDRYIKREFVPVVEVPASPPVSPVPTMFVIVPGNIQAAILLVAAELFEKREAALANPISPQIENLLCGFRLPSMA